MRKYENVAIVFGGGINGLGITRNLGRNGVCVYCVVDKVDEVIYSRYCKKYFIVQHIQNSKDILRSFLNKIGKDLNDYAVLFPTSDLFSLHLSDLKDDLEDNYNVLLPRAEAVKTLVEKKRFYPSLSRHKVAHPATFFPASIEDVEETSRKIEYPVFIRPSISQVFHRRFGKKGFIADSEEELIHYYSLAQKHKIEVLLQEVIPGPANNIYGIAGYFDKNHYPKALFAYRRLRAWPPTFGTNSLMESIPISDVPSIKENTEDYLHKLGYYGIMEAEFKLDPRNGIFKILEINARSWWQNSLPTKCGINIVFLAYLDSIGEEKEYTEDYEAGVKWIHFLNDLRSSVKTSHLTLRDWIFSLDGVKDWAFFSIEDPLPWVTSSVFGFSKLLNSLGKRAAL